MDITVDMDMEEDITAVYSFGVRNAANRDPHCVYRKRI